MWNEIVSGILVQGHGRNIFMKLFWNRSICSRGVVILRIFFYFSSGDHLVQWSGTV